MSDAAFFFTMGAVCFIGYGLLKLKYTKTKRSRIYSRCGIIHGPGLILKEEASWRTWNGVYFPFRNSTYWIEVR